MTRRQALKHFALGPILWRDVDVATATPALEQTAWQRGVAKTAAEYRTRSAFGAVQAVVGAAVGVPVGNAVAVDAIPLQALIGAVAALATFWMAPVAWAAAVATRASLVQRNEARVYARALETHLAEDEECAKCRAIVEDFYVETMAHFHNILDGHERRSAEELETYWVSRTEQLIRVLEAHGATSNLISTIRTPVAATLARDDSYGDRHFDRVKWNLATVAQNLRHDMLREESPEKPLRSSL